MSEKVPDADSSVPSAGRPPVAPGPAGGSAPEGDRDTGPGPREVPGHVGRFWSSRRIPAAVAALVLLGGAGILLYDVLAVRADRRAMAWRRTLTRELAERPLDDVLVVTGAVAAVLVGLWLLVLAATPGLRNLLPMRRDGPQLRAGLDRGAAALVLRDRAMDISGVQSVRVEVRRGRVTARARSHFRPLDEVRTELTAALEQGVRQLGLARQPALRVHVRRPPKR